MPVRCHGPKNSYVILLTFIINPCINATFFLLIYFNKSFKYPQVWITNYCMSNLNFKLFIRKHIAWYGFDLSGNQVWFFHYKQNQVSKNQISKISSGNHKELHTDMVILSTIFGKQIALFYLIWDTSSKFLTLFL
jgi:hypothetical protein